MGPNKPRWLLLLLSIAGLCILIRDIEIVGRWKHKHNPSCLVHDDPAFGERALDGVELRLRHVLTSHGVLELGYGHLQANDRQPLVYSASTPRINKRVVVSHRDVDAEFVTLQVRLHQAREVPRVHKGAK